jgi:hypothetical protein
MSFQGECRPDVQAHGSMIFPLSASASKASLSTGREDFHAAQFGYRFGGRFESWRSSGDRTQKDHGLIAFKTNGRRADGAD